jgi:putative flippase GtrA
MSVAQDHPPVDERKQFLAFVLVGGFAAAVNVLARMAFNLTMPYEAAILLAYLCGMATAYALNRRFVFQASGRKVHSEMWRFALVNVVAAAQVWAVSVGLARWLMPVVGFHWHAETVAHVIGVMAPVFTSYLAHKHFSFAQNAGIPDAELH